jgi:hypothetical protein
MTAVDKTLSMISENPWPWAGLAQAGKEFGNPADLIKTISSESRFQGQVQGAVGGLLAGALICKGASWIYGKYKESKEKTEEAKRRVVAGVQEFEKNQRATARDGASA